MAQGPHSDALAFPVLLGDIGGTNARFCLLSRLDDEPADIIQVKTADYDSIDRALAENVLPAFAQSPRSAILAIAAPVKGAEVALTNCSWVIRPKRMITDLGLETIILLNDFEAQALAAASLAPADLKPVGTLDQPGDSTRIVLGPGTGLGVAGLLKANDTWIPIAGEGGHVDIGPRSARDHEIFPHLERIDGRVSAEEILSGRGLVNLYNAICRADGLDPLAATAAEISDRGLSGENRQAAEAIRLFVTYLARLAGDLALTFMARGGVFVAGGISPKIITAFMGEEFRSAFEDKAPHQALMKTISTFVITHPQAALVGLANFACAPDSFRIALADRRWIGTSR